MPGQTQTAKNINQWTSDGSTEQKFKIAYNSSADAYKLKAVCSSNGTNRVLDVSRNSSGALAANANVQLWDSNDNDAQLWKFVYMGYGKFKIVLKYQPSWALTAVDNNNGTAAGKTSTSSGNVYIGNYTGSNYQLWYFEEIEATRTIADGVYFFRNEKSGKHMDIDCQSTSSGANVHQWDPHGGTSQQWKVTYLNNGFYSIRPMLNLNLALDVNGAVDTNNANVQQYTGNGTSAQQWKILPNGDGSYRVVSRCSYSTQALDVADISMSNGANIQQYEYWGGENQHWFLNSTYATYGELRIYAKGTGGSSSTTNQGHAFIAFYNSTACPITLGHTTVPKYETYTLGTWQSLGTFYGIWYNYETYFDTNEINQYAMLTMNVNAANMDTINSYIYNNTWSLLNNCSSFASGLWNSVSGTKLSAGTPNLPTTLKNSIQSKPEWKSGRYLVPKPVGYFDGSWHDVTVNTESVATTSFIEEDFNLLMSMHNNSKVENE